MAKPKKLKTKGLKLPKPWVPKADQLVHSILDDKPIGYFPLHQSQFKVTNVAWTEIKNIPSLKAGDEIWVRARLEAGKGQGKIGFCRLRQNSFTLQAVCSLENFDDSSMTPDQIAQRQAQDKITKKIIKFMGKVPAESIVILHGNLQNAAEEVTSCTCSKLELVPDRMYCLSRSEKLPFTIRSASIPDLSSDDSKPIQDDAEGSETADPTATATSSESSSSGKTQPAVPTVGKSLKLDYRWLDIRVPFNHAIFKIQSSVGRYFREFLYKNDFMEIHTPKLIATASEGGAEVFNVDYFSKKAFLAQSPQLYKQTALCGDFQRVFEIGPVFRAEKSMTSRHMTEFTGMDFEMEIKEHYHEVLEMIGKLFHYMFDQLYKNNKTEIDVISKYFGTEPLQFSEKPLIIKYSEGIALLKENGYPELTEFSDIDTPQEKALGKLIKSKYNTDFYIMDKFPTVCRPFYTMRDPENPKLTNSYDAFLRGQEILSGAQRVNDAWTLNENAKQLGVDLTPIKFYVEAMSHGAPPHGGCGIGLERVVMLFLDLPRVKQCSLFPRDPTRVYP